jgi:ABC-type antimicrobial peptide transport system permease subunit
VDLRDALTMSMAETKTIAYVVAAFALLALALAAVGLYGVVAFGVSQRVREIAIRIALGAEPASLVRLILARSLAISLVGVAVGLSISYGLGHVLRGMLFGVGAADPATLLGAVILLILTATAAAWLPARRASRLDAARSLRR